MAPPAPAGRGGGGGGGGGRPQGAPFPPRPRAIATFLSSGDFVPGCQTMLHSVKTCLPPTPPGRYPPEIIVLVSSKADDAAAEVDRLRPTFCDRIIRVDHIPVAGDTDPGEEEGGGKPSHVRSWDENCGWTKLRLFGLEGYDAILYIDADCLVVKDVGHLLDIGDLADEAAKAEKETEKEDGVGNGNTNASPTRGKTTGLLAAAPDIFPPDKFNAGVMVLRPSKSVFDEMMSRLPNSAPRDGVSACKSYDGGDTGFLNSFYPGWYSDMPTHARLPFGYNAQRFMHHCTYEKQPKYWDDAIDDVRIIHFSSSPKPWEKIAENSGGVANNQQTFLNEEDASGARTAARGGELERLWLTAYERSQRHRASELRKQSKKRGGAPRRKAPPPARAPPPAGRKQPTAHRRVQTRYKELRKAGMGTKEAMKAACAECGLDKDNTEMDPGKAVGQMFGLM